MVGECTGYRRENSLSDDNVSIGFSQLIALADIYLLLFGPSPKAPNGPLEAVA